MKLSELFNIDGNDSSLSLLGVKKLFDLSLVQCLFFNKWLIFRDDEITSDFVELYSIAEREQAKMAPFAVYFQEDEFNTRIVISRDYINDRGEKDAEMYHYYVRRMGMDVGDVLIFHQQHNVYTEQLSLLTPKDQQHLEMATAWYTFVSSILYAVNQLFEFDDKIAIMVERAQLYNLDLINQEPDIQTIFYHGVVYQVVSIRKGLELLKDIRSLDGEEEDLYVLDNMVYELQDESSYFLVVDQDVEVDELEILNFIEDYDLDIQGYIFLGDLKVTDSLFCQELDFSPILVVMGDLVVKNAYFCGNVHYIGGNVYGEVVYAKYNQGELHVRGILDVRCLVACDMPCFISRISIATIISDNCVYVLDSKQKVKKGYPSVYRIYPTTHRSSDVFIEEIKEHFIWGNYFPNDDDIIDAMRLGKTLIREDKLAIYEDFSSRVAERFNRLFIELIDSDGYAKQTVNGGYTGDYYFNVYQLDGYKYRELGKQDKIDNYKVHILHNIDTGEYTAVVDFYEDDRDHVYASLRSTLTANQCYTHAAMYAFTQAESAFLRKLGKL